MSKEYQEATDGQKEELLKKHVATKWKERQQVALTAMTARQQLGILLHAEEDDNGSQWELDTDT
ncbi:MAG: hypothetical protein M1816_000290 [Peltula sp. TS41687]|nr:MAG: hypothetical protein M1816_000290 [Peltula sp. TS41687]